jgi:hypothetical protein
MRLAKESMVCRYTVYRPNIRLGSMLLPCVIDSQVDCAMYIIIRPFGHLDQIHPNIQTPLVSSTLVLLLSHSPPPIGNGFKFDPAPSLSHHLYSSSLEPPPQILALAHIKHFEVSASLHHRLHSSSCHSHAPAHRDVTELEQVKRDAPKRRIRNGRPTEGEVQVREVWKAEGKDFCRSIREGTAERLSAVSFIHMRNIVVLLDPAPSTPSPHWSGIQ